MAAMTDILFAANGGSVRARRGKGGLRIVGRRERAIIFDRPSSVQVFVACAVTDGGHIHASLVLASGSFEHDFRLSWVNTREYNTGQPFKMVMLHRMASGIRVMGVDKMSSVRRLLASITDYTGHFRHFKFLPVPLLENVSIDLDDLAGSMSEDLGKNVCMRPSGPYDTNCVVFPAAACFAIGLGARDARALLATAARALCLSAHLVAVGKRLLENSIHALSGARGGGGEDDLLGLMRALRM